MNELNNRLTTVGYSPNSLNEAISNANHLINRYKPDNVNTRLVDDKWEYDGSEVWYTVTVEFTE